MPPDRLLLGLVDDAHAAAVHFAQEAILAQALPFAALGDGAAVEGPGNIGAAGADVFHDDQSGEQVEDLPGQLRIAGRVFAEGRPLAAPEALQELLGQLLQRVAVRTGNDHGKLLPHSPLWTWMGRLGFLSDPNSPRS